MGIWIARDGKSYGPYEEQQIRQWIAGGTISVEDLALRDGDSNWVPLKQVLSTNENKADDWISDFSSRKSGTNTQAPRPASSGSMGPLGNSRRRVSLLPESYRASYLYAGFWLRLVAYLLDLVIVSVSSAVLGFLAGFALTGHLNIDDLRMVGFAIGLIWSWLYFAVSESSVWQGTPGKLAFGLIVTDLYGKRIGFGRATGRYLAKIISGAILLIGYLMAGWTARKQALHDLMAGSYVVRKNGFLAFESLEAPSEAGKAPSLSAGAIVGIVLSVLFVLIIVPVLAAIAIPAYQDYVIRTQVAEGTILADGAKITFAEYYANKGELPTGNSLTGLASSGSISGKYVTNVDASDGRIVVTYGNTASNKISGDHLVLVPSPNQGSVSWQCGSPDIEARYLPQSCRDDMRDASGLNTNSSVSTDVPSAPIATASGQSNRSSPITSDIPTSANLSMPDDAYFLKYKVDIYAGPSIFPDFAGAQSAYSDYRTRITEGFKSGTNFSGHYSIITFGCGTGCVQGYIADLKTGDIQDLPWGGEDEAMLALNYKVDSSLIDVRYVVTNETVDKSFCVEEVAAWDGTKFQNISKNRMPLANFLDGCP